MDLSSVRDAFDRAAKKQKLSSQKSLESIECVGQAIEQALMKLNLSKDDSSLQKSILTELKGKLSEIAPMKQITGSQKEIGIEISRYTKMLEKDFNQDISKAHRNVEWDADTVNGIVACHLYREGLFDIADCFAQEARVPDPAASILRSTFTKMHEMLSAMRSRDLDPALRWAASQHEELVRNGSNLELKLHRLQFLEKVQKGTRGEALAYAKTHLAPFASTWKHDIQKLIACLLWVGRLEESPYAAEFTSPAQWENLAAELTQQFCSLMGQPAETSALRVALEAGVRALPTLVKMAGVAAATSRNWQEMKQLPTAVELPDKLQFHSVFVCPVSWERGTEENPPMMLPCGHVLCKQAVVKMATALQVPLLPRRGHTRSMQAAPFLVVMMGMLVVVSMYIQALLLCF